MMEAKRWFSGPPVHKNCETYLNFSGNKHNNLIILWKSDIHDSVFVESDNPPLFNLAADRIY